MTLTHIDMGLPKSYDAWRTASPPESTTRCACGHDVDDHVEIEDPHGHLLLIRKLADNLARHFSEFTMTGDGEDIRKLLNEADMALASCQEIGCNCRGFIEAEDDDPPEWD